MASDARAMLRASRDARKISHPHASYAAGKLSCSLCRVAIKAEVQWDSHVRSQQHMERVKAMRRPDAGLPNRKRKAEADEDAEQDEVKRSKLAPVEEERNGEAQEEAQDDMEATKVGAKSATELAEPTPQTTSNETIDENEWDAFERDLQQLESEEVKSRPAQADGSGAVITAAPISAEELAAKARQEQSQQRSRREEELEAEGEDAAARIDEEKEEMQRLQTRMQQLRDRREALRKLAPQANAVSDVQGNTGTDAAPNGGAAEASDDEDDDEDEDEADEWANFGLHR